MSGMDLKIKITTSMSNERVKFSYNEKDSSHQLEFHSESLAEVVSTHAVLPVTAMKARTAIRHIQYRSLLIIKHGGRYLLPYEMVAKTTSTVFAIASRTRKICRKMRRRLSIEPRLSTIIRIPGWSEMTTNHCDTERAL